MELTGHWYIQCILQLSTQTKETFHQPALHDRFSGYATLVKVKMI
jgi:hypothetical protein